LGACEKLLDLFYIDNILSQHQCFNIIGWRQDGRAFSLKYFGIGSETTDGSTSWGPHPSLPFPSFPLRPFSFPLYPPLSLPISFLTFISLPSPPFHSQFPYFSLVRRSNFCVLDQLTFSLQKRLEMLSPCPLAVNHSSLISRSKHFQAFLQTKGQIDQKHRSSFYSRSPSFSLPSSLVQLGVWERCKLPQQRQMAKLLPQTHS